MAKKRISGTALTASGRWLGGGAVALVHLAFLTALLLTDRLTFHTPPDGRPMTLYRLPEEAPTYARPALSAGAPSQVPVPSSVLAPRLDGPMILIQPEKTLPPAIRGLDLSVKPGNGIRPLTQEDLLPSKEAKLKQFFKDSEEANRLNKEPSAGEDCVAVLAKDNAAASLPTVFKDPIGVDVVCTPRSSAKALSRRNDRFAPQ